MKLLLLDDEESALNILKRSVSEAIPDSEMRCFERASSALSAVRDEGFIPEVAFVDVEIPGMTGMEFVLEIKKICGDINIIFVTGFSEYAVEAMKMRVSGYLMKPVTAEQIKHEMDNLRYPVTPNEKNRIQVRTFGNFEVFADGKPVEFLRSKSKEILAYLIDKQGTGVTYTELAAMLWEEGDYDRPRQKQLYNYIADMLKSLQTVKADDIVIRTRKNIMVDVDKFDCDMYRFMKCDTAAVNSYKGEYMNAYSWAEFTAGSLNLKSNTY